MERANELKKAGLFFFFLSARWGARVRMGNTGGGLLVLYNVYLFLAWLKMMDQFSVHKCRIVNFQNQRCVTVYGRFKF